jgi:hypothetical protein
MQSQCPLPLRRDSGNLNGTFSLGCKILFSILTRNDWECLETATSRQRKTAWLHSPANKKVFSVQEKVKVIRNLESGKKKADM